MKNTLEHKKKTRNLNRWLVLVCLVGSGAASAVVIGYPKKPSVRPAAIPKALSYQEKKPVDTGGFTAVLPSLDRWPPTASFEEIARVFKGVGFRNIEKIERQLAAPEFPKDRRVVFELAKASLYNYEADPRRGLRRLAESADLAGRGR
jgi:hypothetical protein